MHDVEKNREERLLRIALAIIAEPGDTDAQACVDHRGMAATLRILADHHEHLATTSRRGCWIRRPLHTTPERLLTAAAELTDHAVIPGDEWWPDAQIDQLEALGAAAPWVMWIKRRPRIDPTSVWGRSIAVIGTGRHTGHGYEATVRITRDLATRDHPIATLAGIDPRTDEGLSATAARTTISSGTGAGLVIGTGPVANPVTVEGAAGQPDLYVTTTPDDVFDTGQPVLDYHARLQAALSHASLILETGTEPHVLAHIEAARDLAHPVFAVPGPALSPESRHCHQLIRSGRARLITCADDLIHDLHQHTTTERSM